MDNEIEKHREAMAFVALVEGGIDISNPSTLTTCPLCCEEGNIRQRRLNTAYYHEESNWLESCEKCFEETVEHYRQLWADLL